MKRSEEIETKHRKNPYGSKRFERHLVDVLRDISETLAMIYDAMTGYSEEVEDQ